MPPVPTSNHLVHLGTSNNFSQILKRVYVCSLIEVCVCLRVGGVGGGEFWRYLLFNSIFWFIATNVTITGHET